MRPESVFVILGLLAGLAFAVLTPPLEGADESAHWQRAWQVSDGAWRSLRDGDQVGGWLPVGAVAPRRGTTTSAANPSARVFVDFRRTTTYAPLPYLPQALAIRLGRALAAPPLAILYGARLAGLAAALALSNLAIRVAPVGKHLLLVLALTPMAIRQMSVLSADTLTNAGALLLTALVVRAALGGRGRIGYGEMAALTGCALGVGLSKIAYAPLALLVLLCPPQRLGGRRNYALAMSALLALLFAVVGGWLWAARDLYAPQPLAPGADPQRQFAAMLSDPLHFARALSSALRQHWRSYLGAATGFAGTGGAPPAPLAWVSLGIATLLAVLDGRRDRALTRPAKLLLGGVVAACLVLVETLAYLAWNAVDAPRIDYVQGRYFVPLLAPAFLLLSNRRLAGRVAQSRLTAVAGVAAALSSAIAVRYLIGRWYGL